MKTKIISALVAATCALGFATGAQASLNGESLTVEYGVDLGLGAGWQALSSQVLTVGAGTELSNWVLSTSGGKTVAWDIDVGADSVVFKYVGSGDFMNFGSPSKLGFRITDAANTLPNITGTSVTNTAYVAGVHGNLIEGFTPATALSFDANSIYVNLNESMYHHVAMPGMGDPFRDQINLNVNLAAVPEPQSWMMLLGGLGLVGMAWRKKA